MTLPPLKYATAHVVLNVPVDEPTPRTKDVQHELAAALQGQFEANVEQELPEVAPAEVVFQILQGRSMQIAFSQVQADMEIEFHDVYTTRPDLCGPHVGEKMTKLLKAWERVGAHPVWQGLVITLRSSTMALGPDAHIQHMLDTQLRDSLASDALNDVKLQMGLRLQDRYFATLALGHYEARHVQRQILPGAQAGPIRPWEGELTDQGLELTLDINNRYGALVEKRHTRVTAEQLAEMNDLAWQLVEKVAVPFASDGVLDLSGIDQPHEAAV